MESKIINDTRYFIYNKEGKNQIDTIALRMMEQNDIEGLLPFKFVQQGRKKYFRYDVGKDETLEEWLLRAQTRKDVTELLASLIFINGEAEAYLMEPEQICTDIQFITVQRNKCKVAYIPLKEGSQGSVLQLTQKVVSLVKYALDEDFGYLFDLQNAFGRGDIQNLIDLKKWLRIVNGEEESVIQIPESVSGEQILPASSNLLKEVDDTSAPSAMEAAMQYSSGAGSKSNSLEGIFGEFGLEGKQKKKGKKQDNKTGEKQGFLFKSKKKNKDNKIGEMAEKVAVIQEPEEVQKPISSQGEIINNLDRGDSTVIMAGGTEPILIQGKNGKRYELSCDSYVIGSGPQADIVVTNNPTVSRKHARIFVNNGSYYIEDLGSTNGTCVNGEMLRKMEPYKLDDRARIRLSNEDYFFEIRE